MRIAVWHNLPSGGGKRALFHHIRGLVARGHEVESWCPPAANRDYLPLAALGREHVVAYAHSSVQTWPWKRLPEYRNWRKRSAAMDQHCRTCAEQIGVGGFDVLFAGNCLETAVSPIARHVRLPGLLYHGEPKRALYEARPTLPWLTLPAGGPADSWPRKLKNVLRDHDALAALRAEARQERANAAAFRLLLTNSSFSRESILRAYGLESKVCYLGIDTDLFHPNEGQREKSVIGLGGVQPHKGIKTAIEAVATIPLDRRPSLVWIGNMADEWYHETVRELAERCGVQLVLKRLVSDEELVDNLRRATLMIYTSHLEPFGFAPLEANACGTPVVAVAEGGVRETVVDGVNGLLVADRDPAALGRAMLRLLDDPKLARRLGEAGAEGVRRAWTWDQSVTRLEQHLVSLLR